MPKMFNSILQEAGLKLSDVLLIRHKDNRSKKGRAPYDLWIKDRSKFEEYQSLQSIYNRSKFIAPYWAVFVVNFDNETMFAGLYSANYISPIKQDIPMIHLDGIYKAGCQDEYKLELESTLSNLIGKLIINWGPGYIAWIQRADRQNKQII
jgi:hypothetical protein